MILLSTLYINISKRNKIKTSLSYLVMDEYYMNEQKNYKKKGICMMVWVNKYVP